MHRRHQHARLACCACCACRACLRAPPACCGCFAGPPNKAAAPGPAAPSYHRRAQREPELHLSWAAFWPCFGAVSAHLLLRHKDSTQPRVISESEQQQSQSESQLSPPASTLRHRGSQSSISYRSRRSFNASAALAFKKGGQPCSIDSRLRLRLRLRSLRRNNIELTFQPRTADSARQESVLSCHSLEMIR